METEGIETAGEGMEIAGEGMETAEFRCRGQRRAVDSVSDLGNGNPPIRNSLREPLGGDGLAHLWARS